MKISELISQDKIITELKSYTKESIINEILTLFQNDQRVFDMEILRQDLLKREKVMSTAIGEGLAFPHCTTLAVNDFIAAFAKSSQPVDYKSLDHKPTYLFFFIAGQNVKVHMQYLSRVSRLMHTDFKEKLIKADSAKEIFLIFNKFDSEIALSKHILTKN
jgi:mannitol/fructose-specific phosphotransferase system IIA component (Ntr-type)